MLLADLSRSVVNNREQTLDTMVKEESQSLEDVEEGEISDSASIEEITEEDFNKQEPTKVSSSDLDSNLNSNSNSNSKQRVWTMEDLYKYSVSRNYASGLYNFAWAQAVQNKPLDEVMMMEFKTNDNSNLKLSSSSSPVNGSREDSKNNSSIKETNQLAIEGSVDETEDVKMDVENEKEEGELEEGEIDMDPEVLMGTEEEEEGKPENKDLDASRTDTYGKEELEKRINSIREALKTVTLEEGEKSFVGVCSRLLNSLHGLRDVFSRNSVRNDGVRNDDAVIQLSFVAIQTVHYVFCSMNQIKKEQNTGCLLRLLDYVRSQNPPFFSLEQMKEIEVMTSSLNSPSNLFSTTGSDVGRHIHGREGTNQDNSGACTRNVSSDSKFSQDCALDSKSIKSLDQNQYSIPLEASRLGLGSFKGRGVLLPLLDLHKDHDVDSLPSPTRDASPFLPVHKLLTDDGAGKPELCMPKLAVEKEVMHPYETEALKAVSSYQQKFSRSSFLLQDRLPSPTPSGECDNGDGDISGEVTSSSNLENSNSAYVPKLASSNSATRMELSGGQGLHTPNNAALLSSGSIPTLRSTAKSRDPRLRFANPKTGVIDLNQNLLPGVSSVPKLEPLVGSLSVRKQKTVDETVFDGPAFKRQRGGTVDSVVVCDKPTVSRSGGCSGDGGDVVSRLLNKIPVVENTSASVPQVLENKVTSANGSSITDLITTRNENLPVPSANTSAALQSILKEIAVNPAIWMNILKVQQQKCSDPANSTMPVPTSNAILGSVSSTNVAQPKPSVIGEGLAGMHQTPQTASVDDLNLRMKPRDPRRVLHSVQKSGRLGSYQCKGTGTPPPSSQGMKGNFNVQNTEDQSEKSFLPSQSSTPPDIARQFTNNLKSIADIVSASQAPITTTVAQIPSQPVPEHTSKVDEKVVASESEDLKSGTRSLSKEVAVSSGQSLNAWGDVEHLFEGFDDQQKAAIHRERARRIEEQKKMFASRKLCLVLDLDHTLLNSAKFVEVDPMHDEILRKKEEQDREKPHKHLFRFPHMGMWTKLRPGIWNFLEKASKLYELHLYTMGNKIYATEMAKLLDPKGVLFAGRVISRGDDGDPVDGDERVPKSKDLEGVLGMESDVVIIDDSVRVWPHNRLNLIVVERYIYFPCSRRQFGLPGPSLLEIDHDERPEDGTLASSLAVIERIHQDFFSHHSLDEADVRNILASEQRKILGGCRIVFSRVFPVGEANPQLHPLWQTAEQFGAVCTNQIDEQVTHVVANSLGTDKVNWALSTGRFVVHPGWVEASALLYRRANEHDFAIKP